MAWDMVSASVLQLVLNRLVRTRTPGGVGGVPEQSGPLSRCTPDMGVNLWGVSPLYENGN